MDDATLAHSVLERHGRTFAEECGIREKNTPQPLFRLLCLSLLLATERNSEYGLQASVLLEEHGLNSPDAVVAADPEGSWPPCRSRSTRGGWNSTPARCSRARRTCSGRWRHIPGGGSRP